MAECFQRKHRREMKSNLSFYYINIGVSLISKCTVTITDLSCTVLGIPVATFFFLGCIEAGLLLTKQLSTAITSYFLMFINYLVTVEYF